MADAIGCMPLVSTTDGPLFGSKPGTLSELTNMALQPGGFAEARGGLASLIPSGGTAPTWLAAGGFSAVHQLNTSGGWIMRYDSAAGAGSQYSANMQFATSGWHPFVTPQANDAVYFGADSPFSRVRVIHIRGVATSYTAAYEYYNGSTWSALTTSETVTWYHATTSTPQDEFASWTLPNNWAPTSIGDAGSGYVYKYWMRVRITAITIGIGFNGRITLMGGNWGGLREIYAVSHDPLAGAANGKLMRYDRNGTTGSAFACTSSLFSGSGQPTRVASYRGRIYLANGKDLKSWDGYQLRSVGLPKGSWAVAIGTSAGSLPAGTYRYYFAWGYGPLTRVLTGAQPFLDYGPMYGYGEAFDAGNKTLAAAGSMTFDFTGTTVPTDASCLAVYRTQDLTSVSADKHANMPAFMLGSYDRADSTSTAFATAFGSATTLVVDNGQPQLWPPIEVFNYDIQPVAGAKFLVIHQNRLMLGTSDTWYWSDPFVPDRFRKDTNYISLAKATGGRHMGGAEFADQAVLYTEDQTWGLTNIDLDIPNLFLIHTGVGCIAPDSIATGDGLIVWAARDGIYAWDGGRAGPRKVSWDWNQTFGKMSYETHGGSRAVIHNYHYDIRLASPDYTTTQGAYRLNLLTMKWSTITHAITATDTLYPFGPVHGPLGSEDPGGLHPIWAHGAYSGANGFKVYLGEQSTQDDGTNYTCSGTMHFPLPANATMVPQRVLAYYQAADGWATPALTFPAGTNIIGDPVGTLTTGTPDTGADYSIVGGTFSQAAAGTSDLQVKFSVASAASGTVGRQRLFGGVLEGKKSRMRVGAV